jgi:hypothetical protein
MLNPPVLPSTRCDRSTEFITCTLRLSDIQTLPVGSLPFTLGHNANNLTNRARPHHPTVRRKDLTLPTVIVIIVARDDLVFSVLAFVYTRTAARRIDGVPNDRPGTQSAIRC